MTDAPINLRRARKARKRAEDKARGDANAAAFGVPRPAREAARAETAARARKLDGLRRDPPRPGARDDEG